MTVLVDTHAFLWLVTGDKRLSRTARKVFLAPNQRLLLSVASAWEIAIKAAKGKLSIPAAPRPWLRAELARNQMQSLDITLEHATSVYDLQSQHQDPFDRVIAAQALEEGIQLLSADEVFDAYGVNRVW